MTTQPKQLNKAEVWIADHAVPIFITLAVLILLGAAAVFYTYQRQDDTADEVHVIAPQVTRINKAICDSRALENEARARACAERIRIGLVNCRRVQRCRAAFLAVLTYPPPARSTSPSSGGGDAVQQPSNQGHQPPGPGKGPSGGNGGNGQGGGQGAAPAPSPGPSGPPAPGGGPPAETPGNGAQGSQGGSSSSGAAVEVCALERTCVGAEVGLDPKGLIP